MTSRLNSVAVGSRSSWGPHAFFYADEAAEHCDAVGVGEAEPIWKTMLEDAAADRLQKIYRAAPLKELNDLPPPRTTCWT